METFLTKIEKAILKNDFKEYVKIQKSGKTNMLDIAEVKRLSKGKLTEPRIKYIISNYESISQILAESDENEPHTSPTIKENEPSQAIIPPEKKNFHFDFSDDLDEREDYENERAEQIESFKNGNITDFKKWLETLNGDTILNFIKWLQAERIIL